MQYIVLLCFRIRCACIQSCFVTTLLHFFLYGFLYLLNTRPYIKELLIQVFVFGVDNSFLAHALVLSCNSCVYLRAMNFRFSAIFTIVIPTVIQNAVQGLKIQGVNYFFGDSAPYDCHTSLCQRSARTVGCCANQGILLFSAHPITHSAYLTSPTSFCSSVSRCHE